LPDKKAELRRALANDPPILIADEPTGNLDTATGERIIDILAELHRRDKTVSMVTHESYIATLAGRVLRVQDGLILDDVSENLDSAVYTPRSLW
jgi:putative ABC transport system ATP-binding protein